MKYLLFCCLGVLRGSTIDIRRVFLSSSNFNYYPLKKEGWCTHGIVIPLLKAVIYDCFDWETKGRVTTLKNKSINKHTKWFSLFQPYLQKFIIKFLELNHGSSFSANNDWIDFWFCQIKVPWQGDRNRAPWSTLVLLSKSCGSLKNFCAPL